MSFGPGDRVRVLYDEDDWLTGVVVREDAGSLLVRLDALDGHAWIVPAFTVDDQTTYTDESADRLCRLARA